MRTDRKTILPPAECNYVLGNPPFVGKQYMTFPSRRKTSRRHGKAHRAQASWILSPPGTRWVRNICKGMKS
ncbi:MAG: hypothetical protein U1F77_13060 [Kiritimatiellia bacterium]